MQQVSLFNQQLDSNDERPLAERLRPQTLDDVVGQQALLSLGAPLHSLITSGKLISLLFWGPPGVGKTTLARLLAKEASYYFTTLSAVSSGVKELRETIQAAVLRRERLGQQTVLFIDEIHRYSKTQQDALLPYVENGSIILIGATTENPSFQVVPALLSRLLIFQLEALSEAELLILIERALALYKLPANTLEDAARVFLLRFANGDARKALSLLDAALRILNQQDGSSKQIDVSSLERLAQQSYPIYDRQGDGHYDHASAFQKSLRGSDVNAALYWLAKMIAGGEDPRFIARRLLVTAAEDVGLADPQALIICNAAVQAAERLGWPEARIPLALAVCYVARAPKSNKAYLALDKALHDVRQGKSYPVPTHLKDSHYRDAKERYGHGEGYVYTHDAPEMAQTFLPEPLLGTRYFEESE